MEKTMIKQVMDELEQAKVRMAAASDHMRGSHPWAILGIALAAGMLVGFLAAKR
jgi:ElaB/YqjD/DUF883 family membrane-anchored ribosome-binding protein